MKRYYFLLMALLLLAACTKSETDSAAVQQLQNSPDFYATFESDDTRTFVDEKVRLLWTEGDLLSIFTTTLNQKYEFDGETGDNSGTFTPISSGQFGSGSSLSVDANFAVYPYNQSTKISYDGELSIELPATQAYAEDSFGVNANTMVAATKSQNDYFLSFKNLGGFLKLQLYGDVMVKSIQLEGNNGEKIAGGATVMAKYGMNPTLTMSSTATDAITLDCGAGVKLGSSSSSATEFWIVVPPVTFTKGFTITITDTEGGTMTKSTSKSYTVERNVMKSMTAFKVETEQPVQILYTSTDGSVITPNTTDFGGAKIVSNVYENGQGVITFEKTITSIPNNAFKSQTKLVTISLPESVTSIGDYAFSDCTRMTTISASGTTSVGRYAFYNCAKLADITFPYLKTINYYAFQKCIGLTSVDLSSVTTIRGYAFDGCVNLISIKLSKLSGALGDSAFINCSALKSVDLPNGVTSIGEETFSHCASLKDVTIPNSLTTIGVNAFSNCISLTDITIPTSVTSVKSLAFSNCKSLTTVYYMSGIEDWCNIEFASSSSNPLNNGASLYLNGELAEDLVIPDSVSEIYATFDGCTSLRSVTIPESITTIGHFTFSGCIHLKSIIIPDSVVAIGGSAFSGCASLTHINIPNSVTEIEVSAFSGCKLLTSVEIPDGIRSIKSGTFYGCTSLTSVIIPENVTRLTGHANDGAFEGCTALKEVYCKPTTPPSLEVYSSGNCYVFKSNASGRKFYVPMESVETYKTADGWKSYASSIVGYDF